MRTRHVTIRGRRRLGLAVLAGVLLLPLAACSSHEGTTPAPAPREPSAAGTPAPSMDRTPSGAPTPGRGVTPPQRSKSPLPKGVSTAKPKDPLAPATVRQASRDGKKPRPTITTTTERQPFTKPVAYTDGLRVRVTKITQGTMSGHGPGAYPGRPTTTFAVTLTNNTETALDLGVVVVTVTYGSPARMAHHIYDDHSVDFHGIVGPRASAKAVYGFSIPAAGRGNVTMTIDIDGRHLLAVFSGSVKK